MLAAYFRDRWPDAVLRIFAILAYATPVFFAGLLLKLIFAVWLDILPVAGRASTRTEIEFASMDHTTGIYLIDAIRSGDPALVGDVLAARGAARADARPADRRASSCDWCAPT